MTVGHAVGFQIDSDHFDRTSGGEVGLNLTVGGGYVLRSGNWFQVEPASLVLGTGVNYIEVSDDERVSLNTTGFTSGRTALWAITVTGRRVTSIVDWRIPPATDLASAIAGDPTATQTVADAVEPLLGSGLPSTEGKSVGDVLAVSPVEPETFNDLEFASEYLIEPWTANRNYTSPIDPAKYIIAVIKPTGSANAFVGQYATNLTGGSVEPDWSTAPNVGDTVSDGAMLWMNIGPKGDFPPAPVTFEVDTAYPPGTILRPSTPNGHLYIVDSEGDFEESVEPTWTGAHDASYVGSGPGYAYDMGTGALGADWTEPAVPASIQHGTGGFGLHDITLDNSSLVERLSEPTGGSNLYYRNLTISDLGKRDAWQYKAANGDVKMEWGVDADAGVWKKFYIAPLGTNAWFITPGGHEVLVACAAPADADIAPGQCFSYFDATNGAAKFIRKGKTLDGTIVVSETAMAPP